METVKSDAKADSDPTDCRLERKNIVTHRLFVKVIQEYCLIVLFHVVEQHHPEENFLGEAELI
jgi:hypothetical protein